MVYYSEDVEIVKSMYTICKLRKNVWVVKYNLHSRERSTCGKYIMTNWLKKILFPRTINRYTIVFGITHSCNMLIPACTLSDSIINRFQVLKDPKLSRICYDGNYSWIHLFNNQLHCMDISNYIEDETSKFKIGIF